VPFAIETRVKRLRYTIERVVS